jgi:hypothetical protein
MDEKRKKYNSDVISKRNYNSKLSTFQIEKELHNEVKKYCIINNLKVRDFLEKIIKENVK